MFGGFKASIQIARTLANEKPIALTSLAHVANGSANCLKTPTWSWPPALNQSEPKIQKRSPGGTCLAPASESLCRCRMANSKSTSSTENRSLHKAMMPVPAPTCGNLFDISSSIFLTVFSKFPYGTSISSSESLLPVRKQGSSSSFGQQRMRLTSR